VEAEKGNDMERGGNQISLDILTFGLLIRDDLTVSPLSGKRIGRGKSA
jgi:hypothetical protein